MRLYRLWRSRLFWPTTGRLTKLVVSWLPPFVVSGLRYLLSEWEHLPEGWPKGDAAGAGWNVASVAESQRRHWPTLVRNLQGPGPLGVSHFLRSETREDRADHNAMMSYGYVLARAAHKKDRLSILDWGGSLGHYCLYSEALLPDVAIDYHCFEVSRLSEIGRELLPEAHFYDDRDRALGRSYDLVLSSSSLHYFEDWRGVARALAAVTADYLYIARLQTVVEGAGFVVVQRPYASGYHTEYPSWFISRSDLLACMQEAGLELVREFVYAEDFFVRGAPAKTDCRGFLFRRRVAGATAP